MSPCGHRVLIKIEVEKVSKGGIVLATNEKFEKVTTEHGRIVAIGPNAWKAFDDGTPWAKVGDHVMFSRYGGRILVHPVTEEEYTIVNDEDILVVLNDG